MASRSALNKRKAWEKRQGIEVPACVRGRAREILCSLIVAKTLGGPTDYVDSLNPAGKLKYFVGCR
jgi:hypothetical protein